MSLRDLNIKQEYRSLADDVVKDFYIPLLSEAVLYQRAVGFFSSSALIMMSRGIERLVANGGKIQVIASPKLSAEDIQEIKAGYEFKAVLERSLIRGFDTANTEAEIEKLSYIAQLIAQGILDIKIAFLPSMKDISMYHEKMGIITDNMGNSVAFSGSMNESENAFQNNYESFDTFCSWTSDADRVSRKRVAFKSLWDDNEPGVNIIEFPIAVKCKLYEYCPDLRQRLPSQNDVSKVKKESEKPIHLPSDFNIRDYQKVAISNWDSNEFKGIYDMATGTGKTLTALASVEHLFRKNKERLAVIIMCPYQHLVEQWVEDIVRFGMHPIIGYSESKQKNWKKNLEQAVRSFNLHVSDHFCFITTNASFVTKYVQTQIQQLNKDTVLVVDEAHNVGARVYRRFLPEQIEYRLALSATIDRHNDIEGTEALTVFFGNKCIEYSLQDAIENDMLTRYYYYPILVYLNKDELDSYIELTNQIAHCIPRDMNGKTKALSEYAKQLLIKRARIVAGAKNKISELEHQMQKYVNDKHILVYCGATMVKEDDYDFGTRQIELVTELLGNKMGMRVGRFTSQETAQERAQIREAFADGDGLQALVAIRCLDEGVNIPSIKTAFILASSTNPKEYIQRRGRVLRKFPGKEYAVIYDFITLPFKVESMPMLGEDIIRNTKGLVRREMIRMKDFAEIAENPAQTMSTLFELKHSFGISEDDLNGKEVNNDVI